MVFALLFPNSSGITSTLCSYATQLPAYKAGINICGVVRYVFNIAHWCNVKRKSKEMKYIIVTPVRLVLAIIYVLCGICTYISSAIVITLWNFDLWFFKTYNPFKKEMWKVETNEVDKIYKSIFHWALKIR